MEFRDLKKQYNQLKPQIDEAVMRVLQNSDFIGGAEVRQLEEELALYVNRKYCITCANGTDAITLALKALEVGVGDAVFVPDFTFFSTAECPACEGAMPIFVDVDNYTYNIDPIKLELSIKEVIEEGRYTPKAVIAVDLFGHPADYLQIEKICKKYGLYLIEDAAQGFGGRIEGRRAGSFGDISTTSFFPAKPLGCYGDGGAIFTDNEEWAENIRSLAVHGKNRDDKYDNVRLGMNSRLDTLQAAILRVKLRAFEEYELREINRVACMYEEGLKNTGIKVPVVCAGYYSSWAQYTVQLPREMCREELQYYLRESNIPTAVYYKKPMHCQGAFRKMQKKYEGLLATNEMCRSVLSLPIHPYLKDEEVQRVVGKILEFVKR